MIKKKLDTPPVRKVMSEDLNYVEPGAPVSEIAKILRREGRGEVLVVRDDDVLGLVTNSDVVNEFVVAGKGGDAEDIMTEELITISPEIDIETAAIIMVEEGVERLLVRDGGKIIGVISQDDIIEVSPELYLDISQGLKLGLETTEEDSEKEIGQCESCENYSEDLKEINGNMICGFCREEMNFA